LETVYEKIVKYIDGHAGERLTLAKVAAVAGYSPAQVSRLFKLYSPYSVMEYARRRRVCAAAGELYTGRGLYEVALDYGFGTPAGFHKAFQKIFGCPPGRYQKIKLNYTKEGITMNIKNTDSIAELERVVAFWKELYKDHAFINESDDLYSTKFWREQFNKNPGLLVYAEDGGEVCGICLGWSDKGGGITVGGDGVALSYKGKGLHEALFAELERRAKNLGFNNITLGIGEGEEDFYAGFGYTGKMLVQSDKHSIGKLKEVNEANGGYEVTGSGIYDGYINQLWLNVPLLDKSLKQKYEKDLGDCWVQIIVSKRI